MAEYIERAKAKEELLSWARCIKHPEHLMTEDAMCVLDGIPAADVVEVRHGRWIEREDFNFDTYYDCSACGESFCLIEGEPDDKFYRYCPNCGARMDGDKDAH